MPTVPMREVLRHLRSALRLPEGADLADGQLGLANHYEVYVVVRHGAASNCRRH
jgi:hypothetical protein